MTKYCSPLEVVWTPLEAAFRARKLRPPAVVGGIGAVAQAATNNAGRVRIIDRVIVGLPKVRDVRPKLPPEEFKTPRF